MMADTQAAVVWFRRDLRLTDNPALEAACARADRVVALYVHAPDEEGDWPAGAASRWWLHHSLAHLSDSLRARGGRLVVRCGPSLRSLLDVARESGATQVYWNRLYEPVIGARDSRVEAALVEAGLGVETFNGALLVEPWAIRTRQGAPYRVFTPFWRSWLELLDAQPTPSPAPPAIPSPARPVTSLRLDELRLLPEPDWAAGLRAAWRPGEASALARLEEFCASALHGYAGGRDRPDLPGTSRLSPCLHFGEVSPRQSLAAVRNALVDRPAARPAADAFVRQLGWREFAHHLLYHYPRTATEPLDPRFASFPWEPRDEWLESWRRGRTGYPLVDAAMRELWTTGWMHNRARMVAASFLTKNLRQPWLAGARWFWDTLVDADLANNTLGWQWTAGCGADAAPYFRVFNPGSQAARHDPDGNYVRRWLAERDPASIPPIVDFRESRKAALAAYATIRSNN